MTSRGRIGQVLCWRDKHSRVFAAMFFLASWLAAGSPAWLAGLGALVPSARPGERLSRGGPGVYLRWAYSSSKAAQWTGGPSWRVRVLPHQVGHPGEVPHGGRLDHQLTTCRRVEERGVDDGTRLDLEEVGDLSDDGGRGDDRTAEPPEERGARLVALVLGVEYRHQRSPLIPRTSTRRGTPSGIPRCPAARPGGRRRGRRPSCRTRAGRRSRPRAT
jgi:hypothetical protein